MKLTEYEHARLGRLAATIDDRIGGALRTAAGQDHVDLWLTGDLRLRVGVARGVPGGQAATAIYISAVALPGSRAAAQLETSLVSALPGVERRQEFVVEFRKTSPWTIADLEREPVRVEEWFRRPAEVIARQVRSSGATSGASGIRMTSVGVSQPLPMTPLRPAEVRAVGQSGIRFASAPPPAPSARSPAPAYAVAEPVGGAPSPASIQISPPVASEAIDVAGLQRAVVQSAAQLEDARVRVRELEAEAQVRETSAAQDRGRLVRKVDELETEMETADEKRRSAESECERLRVELRRAETAISAGDASRDEAVARLNASLTSLRASLESEKAARAALEGTSVQTTLRAERAESDLATAHQLVADLQSRAPGPASTESDQALTFARTLVARFRAPEPQAALIVIDEAARSGTLDDELARSRAVLTARIGDFDGARRLFEQLNASALNDDELSWWVASQLRCGILPRPLEIVGRVQWRNEAFRELLFEAVSQLSVDDLLELTGDLYLALDDEITARWLEAIDARNMTARQRVALLSLWSDFAPEDACRRLERRLGLGDVTGEVPGLRDLRRRCALAGDPEIRSDRLNSLYADAVRAKDYQALAGLLPDAIGQLGADEGETLAPRVFRSAVQFAPAGADLASVASWGIEIVERLLPVGLLSAAGDTGRTLAALGPRAGSMAADIATTLARLDDALRQSSLILKHEALEQQDSLETLHRAVQGKRFVFIGGTLPAWYDELRTELGWDPASEWVESTRQNKAPTRRLRTIIHGCAVDGIVLFVTSIGHSVSGVVIKEVEDAASSVQVTLIRPAELSKTALMDSLRARYLQR